MTEDSTISQIIEDAVKRLKDQEEAVQKKDKELQAQQDEVTRRSTELEQLGHQMAASLYSEANDGAGGETGFEQAAADGAGGSDDDNVIEAEFEESN